MSEQKKITKFTVVIPCYNEEKTLESSVARVQAISDEHLQLELIIVNDASSDKSLEVANSLAASYDEVKVFSHDVNQGKGAALRTGFKEATGEFVAVQDADLEYDPFDLKKLLIPLQEGKADVVLGSRYRSEGTSRVLYFWHTMMNKSLTFLSNMFTDLHLTDMETCYKVFKREVIQSIEIEENRFGFEPEIVAKVAQKRLRVYEMGISYDARTFEEGKKIGWKDGVRAIYCIFHYNMPTAPLPLQFLIYLFIGAISGVVNLFLFLGLYQQSGALAYSTFSAYLVAAIVNYLLCILFLFRHKVRWGRVMELFSYAVVVAIGSVFDYFLTHGMVVVAFNPGIAKLLATMAVLLFNFAARRFFVFPQKASGPWKASSGE
jgi:dolichol-phosphate mannosyltransferase